MGFQDVQPGDLQALLKIDGLVVIDQRDDVTRQQGQLPGAQAMSEQLVRSLVRQRPAASPVLVYCYHGNQSRGLCAFLAQLGLQQVYNLAGGWLAWEQWLAVGADRQ